MARSRAPRKRVPQAVRPRYTEIVEIIERVCEEHLNEEYAELARELATRLARKRPSPLLRGRVEIWACGIVYALGRVNFLFDKGTEPYMSSEELCQAFGVKKSSGANEAARIRDMFGMHQLDPDWTLPSMMADNPLVWLLEVNGLVVDIRYMPIEVQRIAYQKGLIPYIPGERE